MLNIITKLSFPSAIIDDLRDTFATVFSRHYAEIIRQAKNNLGSNDEKTRVAGEKVLEGFADLDKHFPPTGLQAADHQTILEKLKALYSKAGFDDEAAFLRYFNGLTVTEEEQKEAEEYFKLLESDGRKLLNVDFVALIDDDKKVHGFAVFHVFKHEDKIILHIRQAAMIEKNRGYAKALAHYLADQYPHAIYEANQRRANTVAMKENLIIEALLYQTGAFLGYSDKYIGLRSHRMMQQSFIAHYGDARRPKLIGSKDDTDIVRRFFWQSDLIKDQLTDDNFVLHRQNTYLTRSSFTKK